MMSEKEKKFRYATVFIKKNQGKVEHQKEEDVLKDYGMQGWELVTVIEYNYVFNGLLGDETTPMLKYIFKKPR